MGDSLVDKLQAEENERLREALKASKKESPPLSSFAESDGTTVCPVCKGPKSREAARCRMCGPNRVVNKSPIYKPPPLEFEILTDAPIPWARTEVTRAIEALREGQIGYSFICVGRSRNCINDAVRRLGMQKKIKTLTLNPEEDDPKKRQIQVWRTDGKSIEQVNQIIQQRKAKT